MIPGWGEALVSIYFKWDKCIYFNQYQKDIHKVWSTYLAQSFGNPAKLVAMDKELPPQQISASFGWRIVFLTSTSYIWSATRNSPRSPVVQHLYKRHATKSLLDEILSTRLTIYTAKTWQLLRGASILEWQFLATCPGMPCRCYSKEDEQQLAFLRGNFASGPKDTKAQSHLTLVRPIHGYSSTSWDLYTNNNIQKLEAVQRHATRFVMGLQNNWQPQPDDCWPWMGIPPQT